jgi:hypothetical protein
MSIFLVNEPIFIFSISPCQAFLLFFPSLNIRVIRFLEFSMGDLPSVYQKYLGKTLI